MIYFTKHAKEKFKILRNHEFIITENQVIKTVNSPDLIDYSRWPLLIAQKRISSSHVLRAVYKNENSDKIIITFYPGRKKQYEK